MALLLGDVGGTNARLALAREGAIDPATVTRYRGDAWARSDDALAAFLTAQGDPALTGVCIAVAGPVSGGRARLTNRDWDFSQDRLAAQTGVRPERARLINDLTALGYATPALARHGSRVLRAAPEGRPRNGQALVVGAGTGLNVCAVRRLPGGGIVAMEAEEGHTHLPAPVMARLVAATGPDAPDHFTSAEETFAGRGLARLHARRNGTAPALAETVTAAAAAGDPEAMATMALFADLFGLMLREAALRWMPFEGLYLAGSVARALAPRADAVAAAMLAEPFMSAIPDATPLLLIEDDMAALHGCLAALS